VATPQRIVVNADLADPDWIKRGTWDIPADTLDELREWLMSQQINPSDFKQTDVYLAHLTDKPWLANL
jgi:hypothetical protein